MNGPADDPPGAGDARPAAELVTLVTHDAFDLEDAPSGLLAAPSRADLSNTELHARASQCDKTQRKVVFTLGLVFALLGFALLLSFYHDAFPPLPPPEPILLLVSIDGFRWDYLIRGASPFLNDCLALVPSFPSKTFPNHYTLVTGLYPAAHGIVSNTFIDPVFNATFSLSDQDSMTNGRWWWGEPIWVTARKQGKKAATFFWPGSQAPIEGIYPNYYENFSYGVPYATRVRKVLEWARLPSPSRPSFIALYFDGVDSAGHNSGPDSSDVFAAIRAVDEALGDVVRGLHATGLPFNVVVVGDHGMTAVPSSRLIRLADYIPPTSARLVDSGPVATIYPTGDVQDTYQRLLGAHPNMTVYLGTDLPARFHYSNDRRIAPIVAVADLGWQIVLTGSGWGMGDHGYDPANTDMHTIFVANGPSFNRGLVINSFSNIEVYTLLCRALNISAAPNNASETARLTAEILLP